MRLYLIDDKPENRKWLKPLLEVLRSLDASIAWTDGFDHRGDTAWKDTPYLVSALKDTDAVILLDINLPSDSIDETLISLQTALEKIGVAYKADLTRVQKAGIMHSKEEEIASLMLAAARAMHKTIFVISEDARNMEEARALGFNVGTLPRRGQRNAPEVIERLARRINKVISESPRDTASGAWEQFCRHETWLFAKNPKYHDVGSWMNPDPNDLPPATDDEIIGKARALAEIVGCRNATFSFTDAIKILKVVTSSGTLLPVPLIKSIIRETCRLNGSTFVCCDDSADRVRAFECNGLNAGRVAHAVYALFSSNPHAGTVIEKRLESSALLETLSETLRFDDKKSADATRHNLAMTPRQYLDSLPRRPDGGAMAITAYDVLRKAALHDNVESSDGDRVLKLNFSFKAWVREVMVPNWK